ncbi:MAG: bestrophin-like domain [Vulcanimicrobiaceae bacterium]
MTWIYALPTWVFAPLAIGALCTLAYAGLFYTRHHLISNERITHNDASGAILSTIGTVLAVLLSFMVVMVWQEYDNSANTVEHEAAAASNLHHLADLLPRPTKDELHREVDRYITVVINEEFPAMRHGELSINATNAAYRLYGIVSNFIPKTSSQQQLQSQGLEFAKTLADARRQRLHDNDWGIPPIFWAMMFFTSAITVAFSYFFRVDNEHAHVLMVVALTAIVAAILVLIAELDYPFRGSSGIGPQSFIEVYSRLHNLSSGY